MNAVDIITLVVVLLAIVRGWRKGFASQLLALIAVIIGILLAVKYCEVVGTWLHVTPAVRSALGFIVTFVAVLIAVTILSKLLQGALSHMGLKSMDTLFGIVLSFIQAAVILCIAYSSFDAVNNTYGMVDKKYLESSVSYCPICNLTNRILPVLKDGKDMIEKNIPSISSPEEQNV